MCNSDGCDMTPGAERRRQPRCPFAMELDIEIHRANRNGSVRAKVRTVDLSRGGMAFLSDEPAEEDSTVSITFHLLPGRPTAHGIVRSCVRQGAKHRIGVELIAKTRA